MTTAKWRGYEKPGGASFVSKPAQTGVECRSLRVLPYRTINHSDTFRCPGTLRRKDGKVWCDDCQRFFSEVELKARGIDPEKVK